MIFVFFILQDFSNMLYCFFVFSSSFFIYPNIYYRTSFCFCRHLCTVLSPATPYCSNGTRLLTGSPCPAAGGRKRGAVSRKKYRVQRPLQGQLHDNISDRSQVREHLSLCYICTTTSPTGSSCSYLAVTLLSLRDISPVRGISVWGAKKEGYFWYIIARERLLRV